MDAAKLEKILLLLSSDQPGEVFSAVQAIGRQLQAHNLDWHAFAKMVAGRLADKNAKPEEPPTFNRAPPDDASPYITTNELNAVSILYRGSFDGMSDWDREFIESLYDRIENYGLRTFLSPKQRAQLSKIIRTNAR